MLSYTETPIQEIKGVWLEKAQVTLLVKREDLNHPFVSGNKWWKLKYNLEEARRLGFSKLLTFGGAYSNHIFATASAAKENGFESIGIIRGEESLPLNPVLSFARSQGMVLRHISREAYRAKSKPSFVEKLKEDFGAFYLIPEGGTNALAIKGCEEFAQSLSKVEFDYLCLPVGTGGTMAGMVEGHHGKKELIGFSVLKDAAFLAEEVRKLVLNYSGETFSNWKIETAYHFGGYAKANSQLNDFINSFQLEHTVPLDPVYTGKMLFGICDLIKKGFFNQGSTILALHTGGLPSVENK